jgi:carboxymethylenebutenolidase
MDPERKEGHFTGYDGKELEMYQVMHNDGSRHPSVLVVHEIWGLEKNIRSVADRFAAEGYNAYAPHLFSRFGKHFSSKNIESAMKIFFSIPENKRWSPEGMNSALSSASEDERSIIKQIFESRSETTKVMIKDLVALRNHVAKQASSDWDKIGSIGFCLGGGLVFQLATESPIMATSVFYGANPDPVSSISKIEGKIIASYAGEDPRVNEGIPSMVKAFTDSKKEIELKIYEKAQHAFFNDLRPTYKQDAALDAWNRTISFFDRILKQ